MNAEIMMLTCKSTQCGRPSIANGPSKMCKIWISFAMAYIEMPEEKTVMTAKDMALRPAGLLVEPQPQVLGHRARPRAVVKRHHEHADEHHGGNRADPVKMAGGDAILGAGGGHADDFLRAQIRGDKCQPADPGRKRTAREKEVRGASSCNA